MCSSAGRLSLCWCLVGRCSEEEGGKAGVRAVGCSLTVSSGSTRLKYTSRAEIHLAESGFFTVAMTMCPPRLGKVRTG